MKDGIKVKELYRVTYKGKGIYNELKKAVGKDIWLQLLSLDAFTWLPKPPTYAEKNRSYFTQKGYDQFKKDVLPIVKKYLDEDYIKIETFTKVDHIIYADEYQIVTENK